MAVDLSGLTIAPVNRDKDNTPQVSGSTHEAETKKKSGSALGRDEFLQLLVAQMKHQDPMNPSTDTQYVAQLAQFSSLEQMQNLNQSQANAQAFSMVGKNVIVQTVNSSGAVDYKNGYVDFVSIENGKAMLSIEGNMYSIDQLYSVVDEYYLLGLANEGKEPGDTEKPGTEEPGDTEAPGDTEEPGGTEESDAAK